MDGQGHRVFLIKNERGKKEKPKNTGKQQMLKNSLQFYSYREMMI